MKKAIVFFSLICCTALAYAQEYRVVTVIESIVTGGVGRSRMIEMKEDANYEQFTTQRVDGKNSDQGKIKRKDLKADKFEETKLLNFYSLTGINFQNIASNDAIISSKINEMAKAGWHLIFVTSGVESDCGAPDNQGIFITRMFFIK